MVILVICISLNVCLLGSQGFEGKFCQFLAGVTRSGHARLKTRRLGSIKENLGGLSLCSSEFERWISIHQMF